MESLPEFTQWLANHEDWILGSIGLLAFIESLALVGIVVPGVALLFAGAVAAGSAGVDLWQLLLAGFIGAVLGDWVSFFLGRHYHQKITRIPPFSTHPQWLEKCEHFFDRYGLISIVVGRFIGPIRPVMPLMAGMMEMAPSRFLPVDFLSGLVWAPLYLLPGYFIGEAAEAASPAVHKQLAFLIVAVISLWIISQLVWVFRKRLLPRISGKVFAYSLVLGSASIIIVIYSLTTQTAWWAEYNQWFAMYSTSLRSPWLDNIFLYITFLGNLKPMVVWSACICAAFLITRQYGNLLLWVLFTLLGDLLLVGMKDLFAIERPQLITSTPESGSFPSGHTAMPLLFASILLTLALPGIKDKFAKPMLTTVILVWGMIALSRLYFTVHWLSDIIGGIALALLTYGLFYRALLIARAKKVAYATPQPLLIATFCALVFNTLVFFVPHYHSMISAFAPMK